MTCYAAQAYISPNIESPRIATRRDAIAPPGDITSAAPTPGMADVMMLSACPDRREEIYARAR